MAKIWYDLGNRGLIFPCVLVRGSQVCSRMKLSNSVNHEKENVMHSTVKLAAGLMMAVGAASGTHAMQPPGALTVDGVAQSLVRGDSADLFQQALGKAPSDGTAAIFAAESGGCGGCGSFA